MELDPLIAIPVTLTGETMFIRTGRVLFTAKKEIAGKHVKVGHGKKAMCQQREQQIQTGGVRVQLVSQPLQLRGQQPRQLEAQAHAVPLPIEHLREVITTEAGQVAVAIKIRLLSYVGNLRLEAKAVSEAIHTSSGSSSPEPVAQVDRGLLLLKALVHVNLRPVAAAVPKALREEGRGVKIPI